MAKQYRVFNETTKQAIGEQTADLKAAQEAAGKAAEAKPGDNVAVYVLRDSFTASFTVARVKQPKGPKKEKKPKAEGAAPADAKAAGTSTAPTTPAAGNAKAAGQASKAA